VQVVGYKTPKVEHACDIAKFITDVVKAVDQHSIIVISSKIVAIAEGSLVPKSVDKEALIKEQSEHWLDPEKSKYGHHFTVKHHTLVGSAGIDSSNVKDAYALLPKDPQQTANDLREKLSKHYGHSLGVVIVDSVSVPLRRGAVGWALAHSGFVALHSYIGEPDIFGRTLELSVANRAQGIAAAATLAMGEGDEQKPIAVVSKIPGFITTLDNPNREELQQLYPPLEDDLFEPFWKAVGWINND
jgi:dihydrofolate synthase / folylpolyglutamate synthase